jgi:prepilin-type N-terminal cleavage/methylation domain-containing protein
MLRLKMQARQAGFTMIELMIAMLMSLVLVFACTTLYSSLKSSILLAQDLSNAQESLRGSYYLMSRSIRQAETFDIVSGALVTSYSEPPTGSNVYSCLGNSVSVAGSTDSYRSDGSDLYCDDGSGEQLVALGVTEVNFATITGTNDDGLKVTMKVEGMLASYSDGISFTLALRQKILLELAD